MAWLVLRLLVFGADDRRHDDIASSNYAFYRGIGAEIGLTDPIFRQRIKEHGLDAEKLEDMPKIGELWIE